MTEPSETRRTSMGLLAGVLDAVPLAIGLWLAWGIAATMLGRIGYLADLEWMEGGMLAHAWMLVHDHPLYAQPDTEHIAFVYPPGYPALLAFLSRFFGLDYPLGRAISIVGTAGACAALAVGVKRQGGHWGPGLLAGLLYLSLYNASGAFYDMVRPDALAIALFGWALVFGLERHRLAPVVSGLLLAAAFATKHNLAIFGLPILVWQWVAVSPAHGRRFAAWSIGPALLFTGWMHIATDGHFLKYLVGLPSSHGMSGYRAFPGTPMELVRFTLPGLVAAAGWLGYRAARTAQPAALALPLVLAVVLGAWGPQFGSSSGLMFPDQTWVRHVGFFALGVIAGALAVVPVDGWLRGRLDARWLLGAVLGFVSLGIAMLMRAHHGGFINVLMPLHWVTCLGLGVLAGRVRNRAPVAGTVGTAAVALAALLWSGNQLELDRLVPSLEDEAAAERVAIQVRQACPEGPILSPYAAWLPVRAGHAPSVHLIALWDIDHDSGPYVGSMEAFGAAVASQHWECVIEGGGRPIGLELGLEKHYKASVRLDLDGRELMPRTGWRARPTHIHTRR